MSPIVSLEGKVGLITGIANEKSISTGVAEACAQAGAKLIITYQNDKTRAFIEPIIQRLGVQDVFLLDVTQPETMDAAFAEIESRHGKLDFAIDAIVSREVNEREARIEKLRAVRNNTFPTDAEQGLNAPSRPDPTNRPLVPRESGF